MSILVDILQYGSGSHTTSSEAANALATDLMSDGVVGAITNTAGVAPETGAFAVNAQGTPDTTVAVTAGVLYATGTPTSQGSQRLRVKLTANQNITIAANATGSTRYDWIYIKLDPTNMANPNTAADNVATLVTSRSTSSATDNGTPPTYGYCIAVVTVANGFVTITNGTIADKRVLSGAIAKTYVPATVTPAALSLGAATASVTTSEATTSLTFVDLTTTTDSVTVTIGPNGLALVLVEAQNYNSTAAQYSFVGYAVSGANTIAASTTEAIANRNAAAVNDQVQMYHKLLTGLTAGSTTFKLKYSVGANTGTFSNRRITVIPL